ncbi:MAG: hypothetical protein FD177_254 [Desulfovibrionaceae bacterium]|nr:MAG: hypothetical protein FD177_254 [Desulfovibrionaceae bacterium]
MNAAEQAKASYERERWLRNTAQAERANARPGQASIQNTIKMEEK